MGVPSFYRWLIEKYPLILQDVIEEDPLEFNGVTIPINTSKPNPNGEYDNLYLDMNGIIHPCFHPEDKPSPATFSEVFQRMFEYIDRLFVMVRPRKLLFMAIDGVAPRAKMNQQRARRFRAAKDAEEAAAEEERLLEEFAKEGKRLPAKVESECFDSNVITPGTEFMATLSFALQYYIHVKLNSDPGWKNIKVILSDANVPGEGEHKIMSYIRLQRNHPGYNPNTRHCLYGLDADLIMLALATHEVHVSILREVIFSLGRHDKCFLCGQPGHQAADCEGKVKRKAGETFDDSVTDDEVKKPYQFVNIWILREYLEKDMQTPNSRLQKDLDRIIDDFIFICFFVGNDFLPHMPTLEIREGAIDLLMSVYKKEFGPMASYLSNGSKLNLRNVEHFIQAVGCFENQIFQQRAETLKRQVGKFFRDKAIVSRKYNYGQAVDSLPPQKHLRLSSDDDIGVVNVEIENSIKAEELENRKEFNLKLKKLLRKKGDLFNSENGEKDKVRLGEPGWRERYYEEKFSAKSVEEMEQIRSDVVLKYTEGLCWVMHYYYHGVSSWNWFYPYHYAPFASDLKSLDKLDIKFDLASPFKPFNQLLAVLPSASAHALPECYRTLMTDPNSPIADFYPSDFEVDMNGKRYSWQGVTKLPFIEEQRLLDAAARVEHTLTNNEIRRNSVLCDMLFVVASHPLAELIRFLNSRTNKLSNEEQATTTEKIDPVLSEEMNGFLASCGGDSQPPCFRSPIEGMEDVLANQVICAIYKLPDDVRGSDIARLAPGVVLPKQTIHLVDLKGGADLWHEDGEKRRAPQKIIKVKRNNPEGCISGLRLGNAAHSLVLHTINSQPDNTQINSEAALCPNTIFQNQEVTKKVPTFIGNKISLEIEIPLKMEHKSQGGKNNEWKTKKGDKISETWRKKRESEVRRTGKLEDKKRREEEAEKKKRMLHERVKKMEELKNRKLEKWEVLLLKAAEEESDTERKRRELEVQGKKREDKKRKLAETRERELEELRKRKLEKKEENKRKAEMRRMRKLEGKKIYEEKRTGELEEQRKGKLERKEKYEEMLRRKEVKSKRNYANRLTIAKKAGTEQQKATL